MGKATLFVLMIVLLSGCYAPERNCAEFKTGTFLFDYTVGDSVKTARFTRDDAYSVDYYDGKIDSATIRWFNDCEFILQDINSKDAIHYKIISTSEDSYTFEYKRAVKDPNKTLNVQKGTARRAD